MSCNICVQPFTKVARPRVECPRCEFVACRKCFQEYLTTMSTPEEPKCMSCGEALTLDFVMDNTAQSFHNDMFRYIRARVEFSKELSLMPATQPYVERYNKKDALEAELKDIRREITEIHQRKRKLTELKYEKERAIFRLTNPRVNEYEKLKTTYIRRCPREDCKGYLSTAWKCGTCELYACRHCHMSKNGRDDPTHECNPDDVATAELLMRDTKNCPKCSVSIHKIDGCDQMWCPECHTAFSWKTLKIETGTIHNPHFFEYVRGSGRNLPRQPGDNPCGVDELPGPEYWKRFSGVKRSYDLLRIAIHVKHIEIANLIRDEAGQDNIRLEMRVQYLRGMLSEADMVSKIKAHMKKNEKNTTIRDVLNTFVLVMAGLYNACINRQIDENQMIHEAEELVKVINTDLGKIRQKYKTCVPHLYADTGNCLWIKPKSKCSSK